MVIDFHTHAFPDKIASRTIEALLSNVQRVEGITATAYTNGTLDSLRASMAHKGVDVSVVLPIATTIRQSTSINNFAKENTEKDGIISFGSVHPMQEDWEQVLEQIKAMNLLGIKLHPEYQQFYVDSPESIRILQKCEELGLLVVFHSGKDIGIEPPVHCTPKRLKNTLKYVSGKGIIAAHMGGWRMWDEVEEHLVGTDIMFDTAFSLFEMEDEQIMRIIKNHSSKKIVFGTDSPWEDAKDTITKIKSLPITEEEKDDIFFKNAIKLLKLN